MDDEPRWELLPHDPLGFFELAAAFDRKDLKRAYNRWLRRFKPETFPAEFQRLRAAYETLDERLRYLAQGEAQSEPTPIASTPIDDRSEPVDRDVRTQHQRPSFDFAATLRDGGPEAAFVGLRAQGLHSPRDACRLALLSDVVEVADRSDFVGWLLVALRRWPDAAGPRELLYAYCHRPEALAQAEGLLLRLTEVGHPRLYGYFAEGLWCRFVECGPFVQFAQAFARCRRAIDADHHPAMTQLSLSVFRVALFVADDAWVNDEWSKLNDADAIGDGDLLELLWEYRLQRAAFLTGHPLRAAVDRTIESVLSDDVVRADRAFSAMRIAFGGSADELLDAFPLGDRDWYAARAILGYMAHERSQRHEAAGAATPTDREVHNRTDALLRRLDRLSNRGLFGIGWSVTVLGVAFLLPLLAIAIGVWLFGAGASPAVRVAAVLGWAFAAVAMYWWCCLRQMKHVNSWFAQRVYRDVWRPHILEFILDTGIPRERLIRSIDAIGGTLATRQHIRECLLEDTGLGFAEFARRA